MIQSLFSNGEGYGAGISAWNWISHILFLNFCDPYCINSILSVEWYIADYALFLIAAPWLFRLLKNGSRALTACVVSISVSALWMIAASYFSFSPNDYDWNAYVWNFCILTQLPILATGILLFYICKALDNNPFSQSAAFFKKCLLLIGGMILLDQILPATFEVTTIGFAMGCIALSQKLYCGRFLGNGLVQALGKSSYGIYLSHLYVILLYQKAIAWLGLQMHGIVAWSVRLVFVIGISYLIAQILHFIVEIPCAKIGYKWIRANFSSS